MSGNSVWLLFVALVSLFGAVHVAVRGYFDVPLYGRIARSKDPVSLWIFVGLIGLFSAGMAFAAFA